MFERFFKKPDDRPKAEISVKKQQQVEYIIQGSLKPKKGQFIYEVNTITHEIKKAEFKRTTAVFGGKVPPQELIIKPDCIYIPALNKMNAWAKFLKNSNQEAYFTKKAPFNIDEIYNPKL